MLRSDLLRILKSQDIGESKSLFLNLEFYHEQLVDLSLV